jgi:hypothetical protein
MADRLDQAQGRDIDVNRRQLPAEELQLPRGRPPEMGRAL